MNIFVTDECPQISAQVLDNRRVIKMALETAQLLSSTIFINSATYYSDIYKPTHLKHPCTIWAAQTLGNWQWLLQHFIALCEEYNFRYNKQHASQNILSHLLKYKDHITNQVRTSFVNCTKSELIKVDFRYMDDTCAAYRKYLVAKCYHDKLPPKWTNRAQPLWRSQNH